MFVMANGMNAAEARYRKMTYRERIGYAGEERALEILEREGFSNIKWLTSVHLSGAGPIDIIAEKENQRHYIDVKSSTSNKRRLPVHDHSLVDLINAAEKDHATPLILIVKPARHHFVDPYGLLLGKKDTDTYVYYCYLKNKSDRDLRKLLHLRRCQHRDYVLAFGADF
jgi:Holliday junction resolvase